MPGVYLRGPDNALIGSTVTGTAFAISTTGPRARVIANRILGFSGDAIRGLGDEGVFRGNWVQDAVSINGNHDDAFQSWSTGPNGPGSGIVQGVTLEDNVFLEWASPLESPLRGHLQGIGLFDGPYTDVVIRNNIIAVTAYHGIAVSGGLNVTIENNTVFNPLRPGRTEPWISVGPHKDGRPPEDVVVANNMMPRLRLGDVPDSQKTVSQNVVSLYPAQLLEAPYAGDFRPRAESPLLGAGDPAFSPPQDQAGVPRPAAPAIGALERP